MIERAAAVLRAGGLVAFPTETVYGLGADATNAAAVARIFVAKGRPGSRPLTVHLGPAADPDRWCVWSPAAQALADRFWPGPLTLVRPKRPGLADQVTAGGPTVGVRVPSHPLCMALLDAFGGGVAAPSANRSGSLSPTTAEAVRRDLGDAVGLVLDGGACPVGLESTVLLLGDTPTVLRPGAVARAALEEVLGVPVPLAAASAGARTRTGTPLTVVDRADGVGPEAAVVSRRARPAGARARRWEVLPADPEGYAAVLFATLGVLDALGLERIVVEDVPVGPGWEAVRHRLRGAAH